MTSKEIIQALPYSDPFLFVDEITSVNETGITGNYTFTEDLFFYKGHFKNNPITPGVILIECMAQIGLVSLGIYLLRNRSSLEDLKVAFTHSDVQFLRPLVPNNKITVSSEIEYFRFNKLKCKVKLTNSSNEVVCEGMLSGVFKL